MTNIDSPVLRTVARLAVPISLLVSAILFFQGHDNPGGGFIGGVLAAAAGAIYLLAFGAERAARFAWWKVAVVGLIIALSVGAASMMFDMVFLQHTYLPGTKIHTTIFFDVGIYMIVVGTLMTIFTELAMESR